MQEWEKEAMQTPYSESQLTYMNAVIDLFGKKVSLGYITDQCLMWERKRFEEGSTNDRDVKMYAFDLIQAISATRKT